MKKSALPWLIAGFLLLSVINSWGDAGVLLPRDQKQPNPQVLSLEEMTVEIRIDSGDARVYITQIFSNHTARIEEGDYVFALPARATISDFATWDGPTRIPAVILERKRAEEIYSQARAQSIDPGLLQQGEYGAEEGRRSSIFSARIVPIPGYGTKRLEIEYHESIPVENLRSVFAIPLRPDAYQAQVAHKFKVMFELRSAHALRDFALASKTYPLNIESNTPHLVRASWEGTDVRFTEDLAVSYAVDPTQLDRLEVITYRSPQAPAPSPTDQALPEKTEPEPGFFEAQALLGTGRARATVADRARTVIVLFDTSLSMQWEKLDRSYQALEAVLRALRPADRFNLLLFNSAVISYKPSAVAAAPDEIQRALDFVRASRIRGGTDLQQALDEGLKQIAAEQNSQVYLTLLSDGGPTRGLVSNSKLAAWYESHWKQIPAAQRPHTYVFAVGDDANLPLLKMLAHHQGVLEQVRSTEPIDFKLNAWVAKIGRSPVEQISLTAGPVPLGQTSNFDFIYPLQDSVFPNSIASWVGEYHGAQQKASLTARGMRDGEPVELRATANLPAESLEHAEIPRLWARARVDALLAKIDRDGEDSASIDEIIRLSRKYKFVTPYTSFLAVPRALLRPRVIRPGDPVIRVKTDPAINSVIALFPFGLVQPLRYLRGEDIWQTRFLAPTDLDDGTYNVRLVLRDRAGHTYRENKTFVIVSHPPAIRLKLDRNRYRRGELMQIRATASASTRTVTARLEGAAPISLRWNERASAITGELLVPEALPPGSYRLTVTAEDIAHNIGSQEVTIEILP
jgi:Ca-activated chloride channel family protein